VARADRPHALRQRHRRHRAGTSRSIARFADCVAAPRRGPVNRRSGMRAWIDYGAGRTGGKLVRNARISRSTSASRVTQR
jgi:hypothetical protein